MLLSNGAEPQKGAPEVVEASLLRKQDSILFAGNVEGIDISKEALMSLYEGFRGMWFSDD